MSTFSVYVDAAVWPLGRMMMCHMMADRLEDLHAMADRIGVSRRHFQAKHRLPHYDICKAKRALAVAAGAVEIDRRQFAEISRRLILENSVDHQRKTLFHMEQRFT